MNLRAEYERETGKQAGYCACQHDYVRWLERRAACAEKLAAACKLCAIELNFAVNIAGRSGGLYEVALIAARAALTDYEAACNGGDG